MNRGHVAALSGWSLAPNQVSPGLGLTSLVGLGGRSDRQGGGAVHGGLRPQKVRQPQPPREKAKHSLWLVSRNPQANLMLHPIQLLSFPKK